MAADVKRIHPLHPVFAVLEAGRTVIYAPGHAASVTNEEAESLQKEFHGRMGGVTSPLANTILEHAKAATIAWDNIRELAFAPECLTIYLSNHCQLACVYCFAAGEGGCRDSGWENGELPLVSLEAVEAAARVVATNCAKIGKPLHLVLHGGGEPTLHWDLLQEVLMKVRGVATEHGLTVWSYISTAGVISEDKARWLGSNIQRISLSVDGPPDIQDAQRPLRKGGSTFEHVQRTARVLRESGTEFAIRSTITRQTVSRQTEILVELHTRLGAQEFTFEPAYRAGTGDGWSLSTEEDASLFVDHFLAAQQVAEVIGCTLQTSGARLDEIHGPYCNVLRQVLQLTPDGAAVSCFPCTDGTQPAFSECRIGSWDGESGSFRLDHPRIATLREVATQIPARCTDCVNIHHCARDCPDSCPAPLMVATHDAQGGFRCQVQKKLSEAWILNAVGIPPEAAPLEKGELSALLNHVQVAPHSVSVAKLADHWARSRHRGLAPRRSPDPVWATRGFDLQGKEAWASLSAVIAETEPTAPISTYVHMPYCDRKCAFCDCHSLIATGDDGIFRMNAYADALIREMDSWSTIASLNRRPLTTIHWGGGTPNHLPPEVFRRLVNAIRERFHTAKETEWALESTSSELTEVGLDLLAELGFTHIHVGVQSLYDHARKLAGRRESSEVVKEKLLAAIRRGHVVTVDVIYGLPGQTPKEFVNTILELDQLGVHGISLYKLNLTTHNRQFAKTNQLGKGPSAEMFFSFLLGEALLLSLGYSKTHLAHFSKQRDRYLYYTHVRRGEDLLAMGASAAGSFGKLHYRNSETVAYLKASSSCHIQGATWETVADTSLHEIFASLMTASLGAPLANSLPVLKYLEDWAAEGLLVNDRATGQYKLSATGSWFLPELINQLYCSRDSL